MAQNNDGRVFAVEGNDTSGYVGVSPEYQTYANETDAPLRGDGDDVQAAQSEHDNLVASVAVDPFNRPEGAVEADEDEDEDEDEAPAETEAPAEQPKRTAPPA